MIQGCLLIEGLVARLKTKNFRLFHVNLVDGHAVFEKVRSY